MLSAALSDCKSATADACRSWTGQDMDSAARPGQDRTGRDGTGQDRTRQDRTGQDRTGQDRTWTRLDLGQDNMDSATSVSGNKACIKSSGTIQ